MEKSNVFYDPMSLSESLNKNQFLMGTIGEGMSSKLKSEAFFEAFHRNCIETLNSWGLDKLHKQIPLAQIVVEAFLLRKNVLIVGNIGSGKTKLVNDLLSLLYHPNDGIFYVHRSESERVSEYDLEPRNTHKIIRTTHSINLQKRPLESIDSDYFFCLGQRFVLDHLYRTDLIALNELLKKHSCSGVLCTIYEQNRSAIEECFDVVIAVDGYKRIKQVTFSVPEEKDGGPGERV